MVTLICSNLHLEPSCGPLARVLFSGDHTSNDDDDDSNSLSQTIALNAAREVITVTTEGEFHEQLPASAHGGRPASATRGTGRDGREGWLASRAGAACSLG